MVVVVVEDACLSELCCSVLVSLVLCVFPHLPLSVLFMEGKIISLVMSVIFHSVQEAAEGHMY